MGWLYSSIDYSNKIRSSIGALASWMSPVGPMTFTFSQNLSKADTDETEGFNFNLGTTFYLLNYLLKYFNFFNYIEYFTKCVSWYALLCRFEYILNESNAGKKLKIFKKQTWKEN